jgi:hypothetical protein
MKAYLQPAWWSRNGSNWNQVCNGGLTVAALAVADEAPQTSAEVLDRALHSVRPAMAKFAPDGGDPEGNMYWNYGTRYNVFLIAALQSALGSDFGLSQAPGFSKTGFFNIQTIDPLGLRFNFSDADEDPSPAAQMLWLAREFHEPAFAEHERGISKDDPTIFHLFWSLDAPVRARAGHPALSALFKAVNVAVFRGAWDDRKALYVGFKGGDNKANHSHLDLGSFVLDLRGVRWAIDLGPDDYDLPGYFDKKSRRWTYFRLNNLSHNTLTLDGENQAIDAAAPIVRFRPARGSAAGFAVADLTAAYRSKARSARRGVMVKNEEVLIQDELDLSAGTTVQWNLFTHAKIEIGEGAAANLLQDGVRVKARVLSPEGARFTAAPAVAPAPQRQQAGVSSLRLEMRQGPGPVRIAVLIEPADSAAGPAMKLKALSDW